MKSLGGDSLRPREYPNPDDSFLTNLSYGGCKDWLSHFSIPSTFTSQSSGFCKNLPFPAFIHSFIYLSLIIRMHSWIPSFFHRFIITGATYFCAQVLLCWVTPYICNLNDYCLPCLSGGSWMQNSMEELKERFVY